MTITLLTHSNPSRGAGRNHLILHRHHDSAGLGTSLCVVAMAEELQVDTMQGVPMFLSADELPEKAFFPREYIAKYKRHINELIKRMGHLLEEVENFEAEGQKMTEWNGLQLASLTRETVWHNLTALQDCDATIAQIVELFRQKIRESVGMVATNPGHFNMGRPLSPGDSEHSSDAPESDEDDLPESFQDVEPVKSKKIARALNDDVIERVATIFADNEDEFENFKTHGLLFGTGQESAADFYRYLTTHMSDQQIGSIIIDFARLLSRPEVRIPLLKQHYVHLESRNHLESHNLQYELDIRNKSWSNINNAQEPSPDAIDEDSDDDHIDELPTTLRLATVNHLMFIIHGIGQHIDFQDGEFKSWDGQVGLEGGNHSFRDLYRTMLDTMFRDIPVALEMQSIEWHEELHEPTGVDAVFDLICPEGASSIREFNKETLMDVLYYLSPRYGQLIVDAVSQQLNQKHRVFMEEHPGWDGKVSIFAHSLGSVITYDLLTHKAGDVARNGVRFPGLNFKVENFFAVGSPVPVMILSRGDLKLDDGHFTEGIKMPDCARYFNIYHPIDPIAYRVEPLIRQDMHDKPPVQLISVGPVRTVGFAKIQAMLEKLMSPVHGFPHRIDYVMKRRKREQGMMELAYASASHSSYWMSEDVILFTIMQICKPVVEKLCRYMIAQRPMPTLMRNIIELTPHTKVTLSANARIRDRCTGFYNDRVVLLDQDTLYILPRIQEVACRRKWVVKLTPMTKAVYGDDSFTLRIIPTDVPAAPRTSGSSPARPPRTPVGGMQESYTLKAPITANRDEWLSVINLTILKSGGGHPDVPLSRTSSRETQHLTEVLAEHSVDYFSAIKTGFLQEKSPKGWYEGWHSRWIVLQEHQISCFENSPRLDFIGQVKLRKATIFSYESLYLFRIVTKTGTSMDMRTRDHPTFNLWLEYFTRIPKAKIIRHKELLENSPSAVVLTRERGSTVGSNTEKKAEYLQTKIEGHAIKHDDKGLQYVTFAIQVNSSKHGLKMIYRRYSEFSKLHRQLRKIFPHEQLPTLPGTRMWGKFDPTYLKDKTVKLHGYLLEIGKRCATPRGHAIMLEFLDMAPPSPLPRERESMSGASNE